MSEEKDFFTKEELEEIYESGTLVKMYNDYKQGKIELRDYSYFLMCCLGNYNKKLIADFHATANCEYEDCMQECNLAIMKNARNYDPEKGTLTTFFTPYLRGALKEVSSDANGSKYFNYVFRDLNKVAQQYSFTDANDPNLTPIMLYHLCNESYALPTIINTLEYMNTKSVCSLEQTSENIELESPFSNPEDQFLKNERDGIVHKLLNDKCTSFERYILNQICEESVGKTSFRGMVVQLKNEEFKAQFSDDEVAKRKSIDAHYISRRYHGVLDRLSNNRTIRNYGTPRQQAILHYSEEQASEEDIFNAFEAGDIF